jgi:type IV secretion system protein VirD4
MSNVVLTIKFAAAIAGGILCFLLGLYVSGYLTLNWLHLDMGNLGLRTYPAYVRALGRPEVAPYALPIKLSGVIGFALPLAAYGLALVLLFRPRQNPFHGDARFAKRRELAKHGLLKPSPDGVIVGKFGNELVRLSGQQFVILAAPTRSGKGVGVVVPNLLDYRDSVVVLDIKQENFDLTSGWRRAQGHEVFLFNPFADDGRTHRWNPLTYVSSQPGGRISDLQAIATMLYPGMEGEQAFWNGLARNAFVALALYLFEDRDDALVSFGEELPCPSMGAIYRLAAGDTGDLKGHFERLANQPFLSPQARSAFSSLIAQEAKTFSSVVATLMEPLNLWINPVLDAATSADDFLLSDVRKKRMTIYLGILPNKLAQSRLIINLFFSQLINENTRVLPQSDPSLKHQCLLLMDEFTALGRVEILSGAVSYMAGYNLRLLTIVQSMAQLDSVYGKGVARTIMTNHALQILYAPREQQDANEYSEMLGYQTLRKWSISHGKGAPTRSVSKERRALMLPQELKAMGPDKEVFLYENIHRPVLCEKIRYYKYAYFKKRLLPKVDVPLLTLGADGRMAA